MRDGMAILQIKLGIGATPNVLALRAPLWDMGFRSFFLGAIVYAVIAMAIWFAAFTFGLAPPGVQHYGSLWHAHEMIFGYSAAVIAGFVLTAVRNWTGLLTLQGAPLVALFALWAAARVSFCFETVSVLTPLLDGGFDVMLLYAVAKPIIATRQWRQLGILSTLVLLVVANVLFFLGAWQIVDNGMRTSVVAGVYVIVGLILAMARRLIPFFTERGAGEAVSLRNSSALDAACLTSYLLFLVLQLLSAWQAQAGLVAACLCVLHGWRLRGWYTPAIRSRPLLWSLHLSYGCMVLAFALQAAAAFGYGLPTLALHMFALGGIALITLSMMVRVTLGHTGRDVHAPPSLLNIVLALAITSVVARVVLPLLLPSRYFLLVSFAQVVWMLCFAALAWLLAPMLIAPRADAA